MGCKVGRLLPELPREDKALLSVWLTTGRDATGRTVSAEVMAQALTAEGHDVGATTVKGHRAIRCACYREA